MTARLLFMAVCALRLAACQARLAMARGPGPALAVRRDREAQPGQHAEAVRIARRVNAAAARMPWRITCLARSIVLVEELDRRGIAANLRIGARLSHAGALDAHAWAEVGGQPVNDRADIAVDYPPLQPSAGSAIRRWT